MRVVCGCVVCGSDRLTDRQSEEKKRKGEAREAGVCARGEGWK